MNKKIIRLFIVGGLIILISGVSLINVYFTDYGYSRETVQYMEFWAVFRSGGGVSSEGSVHYEDTLPLSANISDLSVIDLNFNISTLNDKSFWVAVQLIIAQLRDAFYGTPWSDSHYSKDLQDWWQVWERFGQFTPRNITIYSLELILDVFTNNTNYTFNWYFPYESFTEKSETKNGREHFILSSLNYNPDEGFVFYIPYPFDNKTFLYNTTSLYPEFNSDQSWNFSLTALWDVSYHQFLGPNATFVGNATLARWVFKKESEDIISVDIRFDNSHYNTPIPVYTIVQRDPWLEIPLIVIGSVMVVGVCIVYIYDLKVNKPRKDNDLD